MALETIYNYNPTPTQITREEHIDVGSSAFKLGTAARVFGIGTDFEIWTAASGGTQLDEGTDYELLTKVNTPSSKLGFDVKCRVRILNATYQTGSIFITYKVYQSETDADYFNSLAVITDSLQTQIDDLGGGVTLVVTTDYQITDIDSVVKIDVDTTSGDVNITLPLIANNENRKIEINKILGSTNKVIIKPHATDTNTLTNDQLSELWLVNINDKMILQHSAGSGFWESCYEKITSQLRYDTYVGFGSTDNKIMKYTNETSKFGNCMTSNHGSYGNAGLEITIARSGKYAISKSSVATVGTGVGISVNATGQLTTAISVVTKICRVAYAYSIANCTTFCGCTMYLKKGDKVRSHDTGNAPAAGELSEDCYFHIEYIGA